MAELRFSPKWVSFEVHTLKNYARVRRTKGVRQCVFYDEGEK